MEGAWYLQPLLGYGQNSTDRRDAIAGRRATAASAVATLTFPEFPKS